MGFTHFPRRFTGSDYEYETGRNFVPHKICRNGEQESSEGQSKTKTDHPEVISRSDGAVKIIRLAEEL
jgi:hypothetical protein